MRKKEDKKNYKSTLNKLKRSLLTTKKELYFYKKQNEKLKKELEELRKVSCTDSLTKLNNRRCLENIGDYDSLILGDIDHFKKINDTYGHTTGDEVLVQISLVLKKYIRETDLVCRWGGEEFLILLKNCNDEVAFLKADLLKEKIKELSDFFGFDITMSFGISNLSNNTLEDAINKADKAMYKSKIDGRNRVTIYKLTP